MVALLITNFAYACWSDTFDTCIGEFTIGKHYENDVLVFTLDMPVRMANGDLIILWLDFEPSSIYADGQVWVAHDKWTYIDGSGPHQPPWMTVDTPADTDGMTLSIEIAINRDGSPLGSEPYYSFALNGEIDTCAFIYPKWLADSFDPEDTSEWIKEEVLPPEFVIPETPLGTITALMSMVFAFILFRKIGH